MNYAQTQALNAAKGVIAARMRREAFFPSHLFGEPGWNILLDLFVASLETGPKTMREVCLSAGVAESVARRWIDILRDDSLIEFSRTENDDVMLVLTRSGSDRMAELIALPAAPGLRALVG